jgi:hypothetical protein
VALPVVVLGALQLSLSHLFRGVAAASTVGGMRFLSVHQLAVAACWYRCSIALFRAVLVQATAPYTTYNGKAACWDLGWKVKYGRLLLSK